MCRPEAGESSVRVKFESGVFWRRRPPPIVEARAPDSTRRGLGGEVRFRVRPSWRTVHFLVFKSRE